MTRPSNADCATPTSSISRPPYRNTLTACSAIVALALATAACITLPGQANAAAPQPRWDNFPQAEARQAPPIVQKKARRPNDKSNVISKLEPKPQGPLTIVISISRQHLTLYDANGVFAQSPVSTGMTGHATPMGVFSIIQKNRHHRSNIYSNAPMPFMQRITWSGVALHQGALPGYPASHGCIRMPEAFAARLWGWTRLGARVVIVPDEGVSPREFSSPQLVARILVPDREASAVAGADGSVDVELQLSQAPPPLAPKQAEVIKTADAGRTSAATMADATAPPMSEAEIERRIDAMVAGRPVEPVKDGETPKVIADTADLKKALDVPVPLESQRVKEAVAASSIAAGDASDVIARNQLPGRPMISVASGVKSAIADASRKRTGQVAVFVSRKERKLYVRQGFEPQFEIPVTIADIDKPLGTHVFTAHVKTDDPAALSWTVMTMPELPPRRVEARSGSKSKIINDAASPPVQASDASEALSRIGFPKDAMDRIATLIGSGGSLIVSDKGLGDETGLGTDFIVSLR